MMPEMTGMELHREALLRAPGAAARMAFLTGGVFTASAESFLDDPSRRRLQKPFTPAELRSFADEGVRSGRERRT
jgi:hypothetical protein